MALIIIYVFTSLLQSISLSYTVFYCLEKTKLKINIIKLFVLLVLYMIISQVFAIDFNSNWIVSIFATHTLSLLVTILVYRKNILNAIVSYTIVYIIFGTYSVIFGNSVLAIFMDRLPEKYIDYEKIFIMYIPVWIILFAVYKNIDNIKQIQKYIINEGFSSIVLIMSYLIDLLLVFYMLTLNQESNFLKNIIYTLLSTFFMVILIYFGKIKKKSEQIYMLNESLEIKNNELRKIKHDYGAQISYLYGLCLMSRFNDLKKSLKDIINNNESTATAVTVTKDENSLLSLALKPAIDNGIHVIIEDNCNFNLIRMNDLELYGVVSNIVSNAIKVLNGKGIIIAKSYEYLGNAIIKIENNGPKIPEHHLENIFKRDFTIKENKKTSRGHGLAIANELVEKNNGKIHVKSNDVVTEFKIVLPTK